MNKSQTKQSSNSKLNSGLGNQNIPLGFHKVGNLYKETCEELDTEEQIPFNPVVSKGENLCRDFNQQIGRLSETTSTMRGLVRGFESLLREIINKDSELE